MVVTSSRLHAVRYMLAFQRYIAARGYPDVRPLVALSGIVHDKKTGLDYTEPRMNPDCVTGKPIGELEMLYGYGRFLLPHLHVGDTQTPVRLADEVALEYYRADRSFSGAIDLRDGESVPLKPSNEVGTGKAADPPAPLSAIIKALNPNGLVQLISEPFLNP